MQTTVRSRWLPRVSSNHLITAALIVCALVGAVLIGNQPERADQWLIAVAGAGIFVFALRYPLVSLGIAVGLVMTGGVSQLSETSLFQRLYSTMFVMTLASYLLRAYRNREEFGWWFRLQPADLLFFGFALIAALSLNQAAHFRSGLTVLIQLFKGIALYFLVSRAVRTREDFLVIAKSVLIAGVLQAAVARFGLGFSVRDTDHGGISRLSGNVDNANAYAAMIMPVLPWTFYFVRYARSKLMMLFAAGGSLLILTSALATVSRTALITLTCIVIAWPLLSVRGIAKKLLYIVPTILVFAIGVTLFWDLLVQRMPVLNEWLYPSAITVTQPESDRTMLRELAYEEIARSWPWGVGIGNAPYEIGRRLFTGAGFQTHNMYTSIVLELGLIGAIAFGALLLPAAAGLTWGIAAAHDNRTRAVLASQLAMLSSWMVAGYASNFEYQNNAYFILAASYVLLRIVWNEPGSWIRRRAVVQEG